MTDAANPNVNQVAKNVRLTGEEEMIAFAAQASKVLTGGGLVFLEGTLGAGKTTFSRGLIQAGPARGAARAGAP